VSISGVIQAEVRAHTVHFNAGMKKVARTVSSVARGMTGAITAVAASAASMEKNWTAVGVNILASFAAGGPIAGGLAAIGAGIGFVIGKSKELEEAQKKAAEETRKRIEKEQEAASARSAALDKELSQLRQVSRLRGQFGRDPTPIEEQIDEAVASIDRRRADLATAIETEKLQQQAFLQNLRLGDSGDPRRMGNILDRITQRQASLEESIRRESADLVVLREIQRETLEIERQRADERRNLEISAGLEADIAKRIADEAERAAAAAKLMAEQIAEGQRNLARALFSPDSPLGEAAVGWWQDFVALGERAVDAVSAGTDAVLSFGSGAFPDKVDVDLELDELSDNLANVEDMGRSAFMTIGNAIDFAAIRAGNFTGILDNIASQLANLFLNRGLTGIADSLFPAASGPGGGIPFGPEGPIPGAGRAPIQDFLDRRSSLQSVALNVYTPDADSFRRSERQVRLAARRAMS